MAKHNWKELLDRLPPERLAKIEAETQKQIDEMINEQFELETHKSIANKLLDEIVWGKIGHNITDPAVSINKTNAKDESSFDIVQRYDSELGGGVAFQSCSRRFLITVKQFDDEVVPLPIPTEPSTETRSDQ